MRKSQDFLILNSHFGLKNSVFNEPNRKRREGDFKYMMPSLHSLGKIMLLEVDYITGMEFLV
jgi:Cft2 family RNA processing exonuclease